MNFLFGHKSGHFRRGRCRKKAKYWAFRAFWSKMLVGRMSGIFRQILGIFRANLLVTLVIDDSIFSVTPIPSGTMLKVTPEELVVHGPSHCKRRATFYIINDLSKNQVFKIKSTAPERIGVSPNSGFIRAYDRVEVSEVSRFLSDLSNYFLAAGVLYSILHVGIRRG